MRHALETLFIVLATGSSVAIAAKRIGVPYNVALVIVGLLGVFVNVLPHTPMNPEIVLLAFLPILVFEAALFADGNALRQAARPILALAVPGVAISLLGTAAVATYALDLPFAVAVLLGALLAITDTVSVLLAFKSVRVPHRLASIMEGESLFNDGTALVLVLIATEMVEKGTFDAVGTLRSLVVTMLGGGILGAGFGVLGNVVLRRTPDRLTATLASIVLVFAASLTAERVHASPVIAVVVAGVLVGRAARTMLEPSRVLALQGFWETAGFCLNVLIFLLVGMQIQPSMLLDEAGSIVLAVLALHAGRAVAVYGCFWLLRILKGERVPIRWQHVMVLGNIKGALSMAAVLALPTDLPYRHRLVAIVFGCTFVTLIAQALPFRRMLGWLGISLRSDLATDEARATLIVARRGQSELDELLSAGLVSRREHAERRAAFQRQIIASELALREARAIDAKDQFLELTLLQGQKAAVMEAGQRGIISLEVAEERLGELDKQRMALMNEEHHE
ncbi:sodium:proton antiporter [Pendulispora rubella]|uniref:Sodium:proton antiporter n=1 Tax=Pendulispora rubella TaxID=2741070 RepID=A0ABZ2LHH3_9BACT